MSDDAASAPTAIVAALEEEVTDVRARMQGARTLSVRGPGARLDITLGRLGGAPVALAVTGDGLHNARRGVAALLAAAAPRRIIVLGVAGGLDAALEIGALVVGRWVIDEAERRVYQADAPLVEAAATRCGAARGVVMTATRIADSPAEKRRLLELATATLAPIAGHNGGSDAAAVVDLESSALAAAAARAGVSWIVLRAVSDTATQSIPALLNRSRDAGGSVSRARVMRGLLASPGALRPLLALREQVRSCAAPLGEAASRLIAGLQDAEIQAAAAPVILPRDHRESPVAHHEGE